MIGNKEIALSLFDFQSKFSMEQDCLDYLSELRWQDGYKCKKCGYRSHCRGIKKRDRQCCRCRYLESPTADTLFPKVKFPLVKAFYAVYFISTNYGAVQEIG